MFYSNIRFIVFLFIYIRGVTVHVFVPNRHGTDTSVWLQRRTAVRICGVHSVNMANVKACFAVQNLKLEVGVPPGPFSLRLGSHVRSSSERDCLCVDWWRTESELHCERQQGTGAWRPPSHWNPKCGITFGFQVNYENGERGVDKSKAVCRHCSKAIGYANGNTSNIPQDASPWLLLTS